MNDAGSQPPSVVAIALIALLMLFWQYMRSRRHAAGQSRLPGLGFWFGVTLWVILGLQLRAGAIPALPELLRWFIPLIGLLTAASLRLATVELSRASRAAIESAGAEAPREQPPDAPATIELDPEDARLLRRLETLLARRAIGLMVPIATVESVTERTRIEDIIRLLRERGAYRLPVLDHRRQRPLGVIDSLDLLPRLYDEDLPDDFLSRPVGDLGRPLTVIQSDQNAQGALEALRDGGGIAAVINARGRTIGFLAWPPLLRALIGRPLKGGPL